MNKPQKNRPGSGKVRADRRTRRMTALWTCLLCVLLLSLPPRAGAEGGAKRNLTLMIYMCGSNLESGYGAASADLEEIRSAGISRDVSVMIMIGGSESWASGYDPSQCAILEASARGIRRIWSSDRMNMGDPETLSFFLRYGAEHYPAEHTALILWNHGGGPTEGACWDELFSMDHLSLPEISQAIGDAGLPEKLSWIGFDACLMGSLEVASMLSAYADSMIASQEKEPSFGWNYGFLRDLTGRETGAEAGRLVVDAYFVGHEDTNEIMTLSCLDLSKTGEVRSAMDGFFSGLGTHLTDEEFFARSRIRDAVRQFGKGLLSTGEDGYDLVDALDLVSLSSENHPGADDLSDALRSLVLCSRSNTERCSGVSLYYPYANKSCFLEKWREAYSSLDFSEGYKQYLSAYGEVLTGAELTEWKELEAGESGESGTRKRFTLQLPPEQRGNLASAQLFILQDIVVDAQTEEYRTLIYSGKADMDGDGTVSASWDGRGLYLEQEDGTLYGPIEFRLTEDGQYIFVRMIFLPFAETDTDKFDQVAFFLPADSSDTHPEILRTQVWDKATGNYTGRIAFQQDRYASVQLVENGKVLPQADADGLLPAYDHWEEGLLNIGGLAFPLPNRWRFTWVDDHLSGVQTWAMFQLTDLQQNVFCTAPVPVSSPFAWNGSAVLEEAGQLSDEISLSASVINAPQEQALLLSLSLAWTEPGPEAQYTFTNLEINGERLLAENFLIWRGGDETWKKRTEEISPESLFGIEHLESLGMHMRAEADGNVTEQDLLYRFDALEIAPLWQDLPVLSEAERDGISLTLVGLSPLYVEDIEASVLIRNTRDMPFALANRVLIGNAELEMSYPDSVPPGKSRLQSLRLYNATRLGGYELETEDAFPYFYLTDVSEHILQHLGVREIREITFLTDASGTGNEPYTLHLTEPWPVLDGKEESTFLNTSITLRNPDEDPDRNLPPLILAEQEAYTVACDTLLVGKNGAALGLVVTDKADQPLELSLLSAKISGAEAPLGADGYGFDTRYTLRPGYTRVLCVPFGGSMMSSLPETLRNVTLTFSVEEPGSGPPEEITAVLTLEDPLPLGVYGPRWVLPDGMTAGTGVDAAGDL